MKSAPLTDRDFFAMTGRKALEAMDHMAHHGIYPLRLPIGYQRMESSTVRGIEFDSVTAPLVKRAFVLITKKRSSLREVHTTLRAEGLSGHDGRPIARSALHRLLTNVFYTGVFVWKGKTLGGVHPALVTVSLFAKAQEALSARSKGGGMNGVRQNEAERT